MLRERFWSMSTFRPIRFGPFEGRDHAEVKREPRWALKECL